MGGCHLLDTNADKTQAYQSVRYVFCSGIVREVVYHGLYVLLEFGVKVKYARLLFSR
jgi:hypothetical protein